jgi:hypothetical protein
VHIDFDLQLGRSDEMINWDRNEPDLSPTSDPSIKAYERWDADLV